jgi:hypothetical protein
MYLDNLFSFFSKFSDSGESELLLDAETLYVHKQTDTLRCLSLLHLNNTKILWIEISSWNSKGHVTVEEMKFKTS